MRYFIVKYRQVVNGRGSKAQLQTDEIVAVSNRVKMRDLQSAAVILDFRDRRVLQASMDGTTIPKDWQKIRDFYHQHYARIIDDLESVHAHKVTDKTAANPDKDPVSN